MNNKEKLENVKKGSNSRKYANLVDAQSKIIIFKNINFIANNERKEIVDLQSAKYLKKIGYNFSSNWYWQDKDVPYVKAGLKHTTAVLNHNDYDEWIYSAPTKEDIMKWFATF